MIISAFILLNLAAINCGFCREKKNDSIKNVQPEQNELLNSEAREVVDSVEKATMLYNDAIDLYRQDDVEKSIKYFMQALELKPDFYEAHYNLAQILMSLNRNDEALKSLEIIARLKPGDNENLYNLGKTYYKKGYLSKSFENLKMIAVGAPQYASAKILIDKIEKRQDELALENKIRTNEKTIDNQGKQKAVILTEFKAPSGVAIDNRGNIYTASFVENTIYKTSIYGQKTVVSKSNLIQGPIGIAVDNDNDIYVANYNANNILKISQNGIVSIFADVNKPYCMTYDSLHNRIYVTEQNTNKLVKFDL